MDEAQLTCTEILQRLEPLLEAVFSAYKISEQDAKEILEQACESLLFKKTHRHDPEGWLLRTVVERCREVAAGRNP